MPCRTRCPSRLPLKLDIGTAKISTPNYDVPALSVFVVPVQFLFIVPVELCAWPAELPDSRPVHTNFIFRNVNSS